MMGPDLGRIEKAKEQRRLQISLWDEYDRNYQDNPANHRQSGTSKHVAFGSDVMFLEAASRGDINEVKRLIRSGVSPDVANEDGLTALHQCCIDNNLEMCALLLENNANVNAKDNELWTPLHAAATCANKDLCGLLITWDADLLALNIDGNMPYDLCDDDDTLLLVENEMSKRGVTQKQIDEIRLRPEKEMLNDLKRRHAARDNLESLDSQGAAPIHIAAACGYVEVARYLLQQLHVDVEQPDIDGWLPIHLAASWGQLEIVELLVSYGANLEAPTKSGETVYTICDSKELLQRLKEVWDKREELQSAVRHHNAIKTLTRDRESSRRRSNTSILRTSMRDKRRLTQAAVEREKQLRKQVEARLANEAALNDDAEKVTNPLALIASTTPADSANLPQSATTGRNSITEVNGAVGRKGGSHSIAPHVPPRLSHSQKPSNGQRMSPKSSASPMETPSEASDSQADYVRPMHRKSNGQMVPVGAGSVRSPPRQRARPTPPPRDNRTRTPHRSAASPADSAVAVVGNPGSPSNPLLRQDRLPSFETPKNVNANASSSFLSTGTLNSSYGDRHKLFDCCSTI